MKDKPIDLDDTEQNEDWIKEVTRKRKQQEPAKETSEEKNNVHD